MDQMYMISDAAKKVEVESHVLRYWEEELKLQIKRNELGHRYYTKEDVDRLVKIKRLKEQGFQLKAIRTMLQEPKIVFQTGQGLGDIENLRTIQNLGQVTTVKAPQIMEPVTDVESTVNQDLETQNNQFTGIEDEKREKSFRLQMLLKHLISDAVKENNEELSENIKGSVLKELDYQFRLQEEREEKRENKRAEREEEHYRRLDEMLRLKQSRRNRKKHSDI